MDDTMNGCTDEQLDGRLDSMPVDVGCTALCTASAIHSALESLLRRSSMREAETGIGLGGALKLGDGYLDDTSERRTVLDYGLRDSQGGRIIGLRRHL